MQQPASREQNGFLVVLPDNVRRALFHACVGTKRLGTNHVPVLRQWSLALAAVRDARRICTRPLFYVVVACTHIVKSFVRLHDMELAWVVFDFVVFLVVPVPFLLLLLVPLLKPFLSLQSQSLLILVFSESVVLVVIVVLAFLPTLPSCVACVDRILPYDLWVRGTDSFHDAKLAGRVAGRLRLGTRNHVRRSSP